jgi:palmitoyltransferase
MMNEDIEKAISIVSEDMNILQRASFLNKISSAKTIIKALKNKFNNENNNISKYNDFINIKNKRGYTSLHYSIICGNIEIYKFLIKNGADRNITTNSGYNNLILACQTKRTFVFLEEIKYHMINKKLDYNSLFNIKDKNNATLLHWAAFSDYLFGVQFLISLNDSKTKNINFINFINCKDNNNMIALQYALMNDSCKVITDLILLDDINLCNKDIDERDCFDYADAMANQKFNDIIKIKNTQLNKYKRFIYISLMIIFNILTYFIVLPVINKSFIILIQLIINFLFILGIIIVKCFICLGRNKGRKNTFENEIYNIDEKSFYKDLAEISKYCPYCYIKKEKTTIRHCPICQACIENLVRHDIFLNKCIGKNNYFFYFLYKIILLIYLLYFIIISFFAIIKYGENKENIVFPLIKIDILYNVRTISIFCFGTIFIFIWIFFATFFGLYKECRFKNNSILGYSRTFDKNNNENNKPKEENKKSVKVKKI